MAQMQNAQTIALQLEKVRDKVPLLYERDDVLLTMIQQRGDVEKVSSRNMRLPLQLVPGGKAGSYNADGGDLGRGSGTTYDVAQVFADFLPLRGGDIEAHRIRQQRAREGHRKRCEARGGQRYEAIPCVSGQADSDGRERRAGHDRHGRRKRERAHHDGAERRARSASTWAKRFRCTTPR